MKFAPKPAAGEIEQKIGVLDPPDFQREKCRILSEIEPLKDGKKMTWERDGIKIKVVRCEYKGNRLIVEIMVWVDGKKSDLTIPHPTIPGQMVPLNPFVFVNPPVMIPAGTWRKEKDEEGKEVDVENFIENPEEVFKEIVFQTVKSKI